MGLRGLLGNVGRGINSFLDQQALDSLGPGIGNMLATPSQLALPQAGLLSQAEKNPLPQRTPFYQQQGQPQPQPLPLTQPPQSQQTPQGPASDPFYDALQGPATPDGLDAMDASVANTTDGTGIPLPGSSRAVQKFRTEADPSMAPMDTPAQQPGIIPGKAWTPSAQDKRAMRMGWIGGAIDQIAGRGDDYRTAMLQQLMIQHQAQQSGQEQLRKQQVMAGFSQDLQEAGDNPAMQRRALMKWGPYVDPAMLKSFGDVAKDYTPKPLEIKSTEKGFDAKGNPVTQVLYANGQSAIIPGLMPLPHNVPIAGDPGGYINENAPPGSANVITPGDRTKSIRAIAAATYPNETPALALAHATRDFDAYSKADPALNEYALALAASGGAGHEAEAWQKVMAKAAASAIMVPTGRVDASGKPVVAPLRQQDYLNKRTEAMTKTYDQSETARERFEVMTKALKDALPFEEGGKNDQQAMVALVAAHLGMTMGGSRGGALRVPKEIMEKAEASATLPENLASYFQPTADGFYTFRQGVHLPPTMMKQMVNLGYQKYMTELTTAQNHAATNFPDVPNTGPHRTASPELAQYFHDVLAGGDQATYLRLMRQAGF